MSHATSVENRYEVGDQKRSVDLGHISSSNEFNLSTGSEKFGKILVKLILQNIIDKILTTGGGGYNLSFGFDQDIQKREQEFAKKQKTLHSHV